MDQVRAGMKVQISGRKEIFVVLRVDRQRHLADLLRHGSVNKVEAGVPVASLRPVREPNEVNSSASQVKLGF